MRSISIKRPISKLITENSVKYFPIFIFAVFDYTETDEIGFTNSVKSFFFCLVFKLPLKLLFIYLYLLQFVRSDCNGKQKSEQIKKLYFKLFSFICMEEKPIESGNSAIISR